MSPPFCVADEEAGASCFATCQLLPEQRWPLQRLGEKSGTHRDGREAMKDDRYAEHKPFQAG
jgi:hypothetical protein